MPKNGNTAAKRAARQAAADQGIPYTAARRQLDQAEPGPAPEPPRLYPIVRTACDFGCDGSPHPGYVCATWSPFNHLTDKARSSWKTCRAADLPRSRAQSITDRFKKPDRTGYTPDTSWVLALAYALLLDEDPRTAPDPHQLRAAVEADDLAAVDALMQPLDVAALHLIGGSSQDWHERSCPRIHAWATRTTATPPAEPRWDATLMQYNDRCAQLAERWLKSLEEHRNYNGYMEPEYVQWRFSVPYLNELLLQQLGGHSSGSEVQLRDGRRMTVRGVRWGEAGQPPVAYELRGVDAPPFPLGNERVDAEEIQPPGESG